jgi:GNAT superfamily N-acetyltransferase
MRRASREDVDVLVQLMAGFYEEAGFPLPRDAATSAFLALLDDARLGCIWLVEQEGVAVGYLVLTLAWSMEFGGVRGFVDDFFVRPSARNRGLGAAALDVVRRECAAMGIRALLVETGPDDHPARRLYARAGFTANDRVFLTQPLTAPLHET